MEGQLIEEGVTEYGSPAGDRQGGGVLFMGGFLDLWTAGKSIFPLAPNKLHIGVKLCIFPTKT